MAIPIDKFTAPMHRMFYTDADTERKAVLNGVTHKDRIDTPGSSARLKRGCHIIVLGWTY